MILYLHSLMFLYLCIPSMQKELAKFKEQYSNFPKRKDNHRVLQSGTAADWPYKHSDQSGNTNQGLVSVSKETINDIIADNYPGEYIPDLFSYALTWLSAFQYPVMVGLNSNHNKFDYMNIWACFFVCVSIFLKQTKPTHLLQTFNLSDCYGMPQQPW